MACYCDTNPQNIKKEENDNNKKNYKSVAKITLNIVSYIGTHTYIPFSRKEIEETLEGLSKGRQARVERLKRRETMSSRDV